MPRFQVFGGSDDEPRRPEEAGPPEPEAAPHWVGPTAGEENPSAGEESPSERWKPPSGESSPPDEPAPIEDDSQSGDEAEPEPERSGESEPETERQPTSRVSVIDEQPQRPAPPEGASEEEYKWHTYKHYPSGRPDAIEFIDTYKAFGRNRILRGLNMSLPEGMVSMILGPSGTGKPVCIQHMVGLLYPDQGDILVHGESVPNMPDDDLFEMRK